MIELRLSSASATFEKVAELLCQLGVEASVSPTTNVCKNEEGSFQIEPGAHILMPDCSKALFASTVWPALKETFSLRCGWVDASEKAYRGCTENYVRPSLCPATLRAQMEKTFNK